MSQATGIAGADATLTDLFAASAIVDEHEKANVHTGKTGESVSITEKSSGGSIGHPLELEVEQEPITSRWELWSWYAYYFGNNSAGTLSYAPLIFQSILSQASVDGQDHSQACGDTACVVRFGGRWTNIDSVILISNGIVFAINGTFLICFGSLGDYGRWKKAILFFWTIVCWATQFAFLSLKDPSQYRSAIGLYIATYLSYNLCQAYWTASLPLLARNTPEARDARTLYLAGEISQAEYTSRRMLQRNRLSNIGFGAMSVGYTLTLIIALGAAYGLHANTSSSANFRAAVIIVGIATGVWILVGVPFFFLEKTRSNKLAQGQTQWSSASRAYWHVLKNIPKLSQTWLYLVGFFIISDGFATTLQIYNLCQNTIVDYSTTVSTELYIVQGAANAVGIGMWWLIQRHFKIPTKTILMTNCFILVLMAVWGCIGIGTTKFGYHNTWEVWAFSVIDCAAAAPFTAFSATMLSDLCPKGREVTFFSLYALVNKSTAWIGPIISGVIIDRTGNTWKGFPFALGMTIVGFALICCINVDKGRKECEEYVKLDPTLGEHED